ncbi:MAG: penicillin-binding protein [Candidatus Nealsonbacteria bacterium CG_4_9_14_0_2_um_filter_37_38]|uniref:Penicillin-binding protein n=1 Tax=Candidatus Nealsonbacteria bacterium CG_4_10_14_0_8_um_filter_37_14 TaxID=1974684 RepID=A0A2M7R7S9_9BACT|nr:MAG: penicillin-binding protein [Candidatus Nealsonbacteria bacterium CG11_big_fil_rev_8_21_14_0_20_37_68]PIW92188.1 MAG: penicillin-binding protein [Candidatus Nealsonbacteria bacterium CG_4_8_14_3_um_filter_37_23]PIY89553.1 MAG: penicillin-binding protein [Candidatus Nealsonbacteria bacterium CG_4_10_14_0_8_um_filter_37_14]PJC51473.1 MAG: penicillin-binding protein [Candidatus Nealsonbacteria bacterium CG_4_9_14_0_2_um_filter_37_38]
MPIRKYYQKTFSKKKPKRKILKALRIFGIIFFLFILAIFFLFLYYGRDLPRPEIFTEKMLFEPTKIYDRTGKILLYQIYGEEKREYVSLKEIPEYLQKSVIVAEDANFYHHFGLDFKGMIRALLVDLKLKEPIQGGSTITQQLARSSFLTNEKTIERKIKEIILTLDLERKFSKDQILEFYLNQIPFGQNCYGVQSASKTYFGKPVSEISLPEAATLVALIKAPSLLSPYEEKNLNELLLRKDYILNRMVKAGFLEKEKAEELKKQKIEFTPLKEIRLIKTPHFVLEVKNYLIGEYGENYLQRKGLKVYTTLDWELQHWAEEIVENNAEINKKYNAHNASLVAINPWDGEILAMVGSRDYFAEPYPEGCNPDRNECLFAPQFNVATLGKRQPGSAFKPFAYLTAFEKGFTPDMILWDVKTNFGTGKEEYIPENYDKKFRGPITFRNALAQSINVPSVKVLYLAGGEDTLETARKMGITTLNQPFFYYGLPLVLGEGAVNLLEMTSAYGGFATEGYWVSPSFILKIEDSKGNIIEKNQKELKKILKTQPCRLINDILSDNEARAPIFGLRSPLYFENYQVAVKTGTTENFRDGWVMGYTSSISVGVWVGNNDNSPMFKEPGVVVAGPIFHQFMEKALQFYPPKKFEKPEPCPSFSVWNLNGKIDSENPHSILHYIKKEDPLESPNLNPEADPQYSGWEKGIKNFLENF